MSLLNGHSHPRLAAKADLRMDPVTGQPVLLYPEGLLQLNDSAHAILLLCDGSRSVSGIAMELAEQFECEPAELEADVQECLQGLHQRQLLVFTP